MVRRRRRSVGVQFVTLSDTSIELGTTTSAPSHERTVLERMPMRRTSPCTSPIWTASPTRTGRSKSTIRPETKLLTTFCRPKPTPMPNAPPRIVTRSRLMPSIENGQHEADEDDGVAEQARQGVRQARAQTGPRKDLFLEHDPHHRRDEKRGVDGDEERDDVGDRDRQRAVRPLGGENPRGPPTSPGPAGRRAFSVATPQAVTVRKPRIDVGTPLQEDPVGLHQPEQVERPHAQQEGEDALQPGAGSRSAGARGSRWSGSPTRAIWPGSCCRPRR